MSQFAYHDDVCAGMKAVRWARLSPGASRIFSSLRGSLYMLANVIPVIPMIERLIFALYFRLVTLILPGIMGFFAGVFDDPAGSLVIPRMVRHALAPIVLRLSMAWGASVKNSVSGRREPTPDTKPIFDTRR